MARPTRDDARLILELANWYTAAGVPEAANWIRSKDFVQDFDGFDKRFPDGSEGRLRVNRFLWYHETVGTLWKQGLLNEELLFDWIWAVGAWEQIRDVAIGIRKKAGVDALCENFEAMAERQQMLVSRPRRARTPSAKRAPTRRAPAKKAPAKKAAAKKAAAKRAAARRRAPAARKAATSSRGSR